LVPVGVDIPGTNSATGSLKEKVLFTSTPATIAIPAVKPKEPVLPVKPTATVSPITKNTQKKKENCKLEDTEDNHAETAEDEETVTIEKCLELLASQANNNTGNNSEEDKPESDPEEKTTTTKKTPTPAQAPHTDIPAPPGPLGASSNGATDMRQVLVSDFIVFILSLIPISVFFLLVRKSIVSYLDLQMKNKSSLFFLQYSPISCVSNKFLVESVI
jgi:hypothetical protein